MSKIKSITMEEGYLALQLSNKKDVDTYMIELMKKSPNTLACIQKKKNSTLFLYDIQELISLERFLSLWIFTAKDALSFTIHLFQVLSSLQKQLPVSIQLDCIYVDESLENIKCVILPIHEHRNDENDPNSFLYEYLKCLHLQKNEYLLFSMYKLIYHEWNSFDELLDVLLEMKLPTFFTFLTDLWFLSSNQSKIKQENELRYRDYQAHQRFIRTSEKLENQLDNDGKGNTVNLFEQEEFVYLEDDNQNRYIVENEMIIGRNENCHVCINSNAVSAQHAKIIKDERGYVLQDLESSNGTFVNGKKLRKSNEVILQHQDKIMFAKEKMIFLSSIDELE